MYLSGLLALPAFLFSQVIEGSVVNSVNGTPVAGAAVTILAAGKTAYQTLTDSQGIFRIEDVKPGYYTANFSGVEFVALERDSIARRPFAVFSGSDPVRLHAALVPLGKIAGRVLDANGDAIPGAEVTLDSGRLGRAKTADENGKFLFSAAPGRYTLLAKPPQNLKPPPADGEEHLGWVPTYYPGTPDARAAAKIILRAGSELWGNDVKLRTLPMRRVRGVVLDDKGDSVAHIPVHTARTDDTLTEDLETLSGDNGEFEFSKIYTGEWCVFAEAGRNGIKLMGSRAVQVGDRDLDKVELQLAAPFSLSGNVSLLGTARAGKITISLRPEAIAGSQGLSHGSPDKEGNFNIDHVYPGTYEVIANTPGPPYFLASLMQGERDILGQRITLYPGALPIRVVFDSKGGGVRGKVEECGSAIIALVPQETTARQVQFVRTGKCNDDGRFEISDVRPGDYHAFAFDRWESASELLAALNQNLLNKAVGVHVTRGQSAPVELTVTVREQ